MRTHGRVCTLMFVMPGLKLVITVGAVSWSREREVLSSPEAPAEAPPGERGDSLSVCGRM